MFAKRLSMAFELLSIPPESRAAWTVEQFKRMFNQTIPTMEVQMWINGATMPSDANMERMAEIVKSDPIWLQHGH